MLPNWRVREWFIESIVARRGLARVDGEQSPPGPVNNFELLE